MISITQILTLTTMSTDINNGLESYNIGVPNTTSTNINDEQSSILSIIGKRTHQLMIENYKAIEINYNILVINNLLCNGKCHIVALFKEHLINLAEKAVS